jgi:tricorn protease
VDLEVGDYVLAIDGHEIKGGDNYWKILNDTLNDYVTLKVTSSTPNGTGEARQVRIRSTGSLRNIKYQEWVENNRDWVETYSKGQIAYVHIRGMSTTSLRILENEFDRFWNAKGIVIDIRFNGGGNLDQEVLDILERKPYGIWHDTRWDGRSFGQRPRQGIAGPKVMMINHRSGSNSEVTSQGFRDLGLGRLVGNPTAAAIIGAGGHGLINGASIWTPEGLAVTYDPTKPDNYGINLENYGVIPDVWVENTPEDVLNGFDRELKAAVDEALRMLNTGAW